MTIHQQLPDMILFSDYGGSYHNYIEELYRIFEKDFISNKPVFRGKKLALKYHPEVSGKAYTFYHMTHKGSDEANRTPDLRRCERLSWAKPSIERCDHWTLKVWTQERKGKKRICIWVEFEDQPDYIVILDVREKYILPWTAYVIEYSHEKRKKQKEYDEFIKAKTA